MWGKLAIALAMLSWSVSLSAQPPTNKRGVGMHLFGNLTISPSPTPQQHTLYGISGGTAPTQSLAGIKTSETGDCIGFVDSTPDHQLTLTGFFRYLRLQVRSSGDTVMLVKGPGGTWCNDDVSDRNPIIAGGWLQGTYSIWVGSYEPNASFPYILEVSTVQDGLAK
ncbi:MAG: hypothetical protein ACK4QL_03015 [Pseudanabaenaceae cyanobacterium]